MKAFLPWNWPALALQIAGFVLFLVAMHFIVLPWYYGREIKREQEIASAKAAAAVAAREADNAKIYKEATDAKNKALEANLAAATAADQSRAGLLDSVRASEDRAKTDHATCLQHARALGEVFDTGTELLGRIAKEADGHTADKIACHAAWPK